MIEESQQYFMKVIDALNNFNHQSISECVDKVLEANANDRNIIIFGNGGSAANASHFCGDMIKGLAFPNKKRFKAICLNDNVPALMAIANDISYSEIFLEQLKNILMPKDLVIGISGSGNSPNVVKAMEYAKNNGANTVAICGFNGGTIGKICDVVLHANINDMEVAEDLHLIFFHCIKQIIMNKFK